MSLLENFRFPITAHALETINIYSLFILTEQVNLILESIKVAIHILDKQIELL